METSEATTLLALASEESLKEITEAASTTCRTESREIETTKGIACASASSTTAKALELLSLSPLFTILVVFLPLLRIANHLVCLLQRLELSLRLRVVGVQIGVKLLGALQVCLLHILLRYRLVDA